MSESPSLEWICEDGPLLAVNKPAGLLTQGVPQGLPSLEFLVKQYLREKYEKQGNVYLGVPHRLDRPVSGIVIFAKNSKAAARLAEQFRQRSVEKRYYAIVQGELPATQGQLEDWLLKDAAAAHVTVVPPETVHAKLCQLRYRTITTAQGLSLVEVELITGRMHQIRVQLAHAGCPVVGDWQYGSSLTFPGESTTGPRRLTNEGRPVVDVVALHAGSLKLHHPIRYDRINLRAPFPPGWQSFPFDLIAAHPLEAVAAASEDSSGPHPPPVPPTPAT